MISARQLDADDPLAAVRTRFVGLPGVVAYLDGGSLGRPFTGSIERGQTFIREEWPGGLAGRGNAWSSLPLEVGDELGIAALGAASGQVAFGDSTAVVLYKLVSAALDARPDRTEIVIARDRSFPELPVVEAIAAARGLSIRWIDTDAARGITPDLAAMRVGPKTALTVFSAVAHRSGYLSDVKRITAHAHAAGALALWDLSLAAGVVRLKLDAWGVDLAFGGAEGYLGGGPGAPAYLYVRRELQQVLRQPIPAGGDESSADIRRFLSGTPSIVSLQTLREAIAFLADVGIVAVRVKSVALTSFAVELCDELLPEVRVTSPRDPDQRGSQITLDGDGLAELLPALRTRGVVLGAAPDGGIRIGMSPLCTSFAEVDLAIRTIAALLS